MVPEGYYRKVIQTMMHIFLVRENMQEDFGCINKEKQTLKPGENKPITLSYPE